MRTGSLVVSRAPRVESSSTSSLASTSFSNFFSRAEARELGPALKHVNALRADGGEQVVQVLRGMDVMGNQVIHLLVSEIALSLSGINEFRNVVKSQAASLRRRPAWK